MKNEEVANIAKNYYDSDDADNFYYNIWGGEDIHVGWYLSDSEPILDASHRTVEKMVEKLPKLTADTKVIDIGAGYGGSARYMAKKFGCQVECLNISEKENEKNIQKNKEQGLDHLINVYQGNFEEVPYDDETFDVVWCQDSILHSGNKKAVFEEVARILKKGGHFIFTDPMQIDNCPEGVLDPVLKRIHLDSMGSVGKYREFAKGVGLEEVEVEEQAALLPAHYGRVLEELKKNEDKLQGKVSQQYIEGMKEGLGHWVEKGNKGYLNWGILHFKK
jgi:sarcosine/dimethylglycine N-methyltransferase